MNMTNDDHNPHTDIMAAEVSARYRASAVEMTPAELDRTILQQAAAEVRNGNSVGWGLSWLRPATFVAMLGLTVALLLEFGQYERAAPGMSDRIATLDAESLPANKRNADGDAFRSAVNATAKQVRDVDASADIILKEMPGSEDVDASGNVTPKEMPTAEGAVATAIPAAAALASDTATELPRCSDAQRQNAAEWWLCIADLRSNGFQDAAELEADDFQHAFPDYIAQ
jgi:hypothetical protein